MSYVCPELLTIDDIAQVLCPVISPDGRHDRYIDLGVADLREQEKAMEKRQKELLQQQQRRDAEVPAVAAASPEPSSPAVPEDAAQEEPNVRKHGFGDALYVPLSSIPRSIPPIASQCEAGSGNLSLAAAFPEVFAARRHDVYSADV